MSSSKGPTYNLHSIAVHLALVKTGKVILFSGDHKNIWNWNKGESSIWDPENPEAKRDPNLKRNLFCSGHCFLPDGRILVAGGQSTNNHPVTVVLSVLGILPAILKLTGRQAADHDIHTFNPEIEEWRYHFQMPRARWYPTCVTLPNGNALIVSGTHSHAYHSLLGGFINLDYEIFEPLTDTLSEPKKFMDKIDLYPFLQVLPRGILFVHSEHMTYFWDIAQQKVVPNLEFHTKSEGTRTYPGMGSCVLLPLDENINTAKILLIGGSTKLSPNNNTDATDVAEIFTVDLDNIANSGWEKVACNPLRRFLCDSVLLPNGTVLVTNGARKGIADDNKEAVKEIEIFDPRDNSWTVIGELQRSRLYHSSAVLLPDGTVLVAGSTGHRWIDATISPHDHFEHDVEIVIPPYLYGNPHRPSIKNVQSSISYRTSFEVVTDDADDIHMASLIRLSSTTHNNNMDQRSVMLSIMDRSSGLLKLSTPKDGSWAPPGHYMLFLVDDKGVPSVGNILSLK